MHARCLVTSLLHRSSPGQRARLHASTTGALSIKRTVGNHTRCELAKRRLDRGGRRHPWGVTWAAVTLVMHRRRQPPGAIGVPSRRPSRTGPKPPAGAVRGLQSRPLVLRVPFPGRRALITMRKVAMLTAGGFAPCLSAAVGGLINRYSQLVPEVDIIGYRHGYQGLLSKDFLGDPRG